MADSHSSHSPTAAAHADHSHDAEHVAKHVKGYLYVGGFLFVATALTVGLSYVDFDSWSFLPGHGWNIIVAMILATIKAGTVAAIFMHLKGERITIWRFLIFTAIFAAGLFLLTFLHQSDPIPGTTHSVHL